MFSGARTLVMMTNFSDPNYPDTVESFDGNPIIHPGYSPKKNYINDIALLRTRRFFPKHHAYSLCYIGYKGDDIGINKRTNNI